MILHLLIDTAFGFLSTIFTLIPTIPAIEHIDYLINGISPMFFRPIIILFLRLGLLKSKFVTNIAFGYLTRRLLTCLTADRVLPDPCQPQ